MMMYTPMTNIAASRRITALTIQWAWLNRLVMSRLAASVDEIPGIMSASNSTRLDGGSNTLLLAPCTRCASDTRVTRRSRLHRGHGRRGGAQLEAEGRGRRCGRIRRMLVDGRAERFRRAGARRRPSHEDQAALAGHRHRLAGLRLLDEPRRNDVHRAAG